jgi:pimeloyl-ACP methyl ester carboxylesterase
MKLARDGSQLSFDIAGAGPPEFLFVHGLGGDRTHFTPQMEYFARQGRVLTAELRGHGESDKPQQAYSIEGFAEDLIWLCTRQQMTKPVIVGQSMGGNMALEIAARHPDFPAGLVLLDSGVLFPASAGTVFAGYLEGLRGPDFPDQVRKIVADSCLPPTPAAPMLNRPFWRRHSTCWCLRLKVCSPGMCIGRVSAPRRVKSRCSTSKRPVGSRIWIALRHCARNWSRLRPSAPGISCH